MMIQPDKPVAVDIGFNDQVPAAAFIQIGAGYALLKNPMEYFIAPAGRYNEKTKQWEVEGYSFVHVSNLPNATQYRARLAELDGRTPIEVDFAGERFDPHKMTTDFTAPTTGTYRFGVDPAVPGTDRTVVTVKGVEVKHIVNEKGEIFVDFNEVQAALHSDAVSAPPKKSDLDKAFEMAAEWEDAPQIQYVGSKKNMNCGDCRQPIIRSENGWRCACSQYRFIFKKTGWLGKREKVAERRKLGEV